MLILTSFCSLGLRQIHRQINRIAVGYKLVQGCFVVVYNDLEVDFKLEFGDTECEFGGPPAPTSVKQCHNIFS